MDFSNPLIVFAMREESQDVFNDYKLLHTGIGKINAAYNLTKALEKEKPSLVINMGTAGSRKHKGGSIVNCTGFIQRDMDVTALGCAPFETPFSDTPIQIDFGHKLDTLPNGICGTGDNFDTTEAAGQFDVVDMEAYALAKICQLENIDFLCLKYVSDGADGDSHQDWHQSLHQTAEELLSALETIKQNQ